MSEEQFEAPLSQWESQRAYSREIFQALKDRETPDKKLRVYPFVCKDVRGSGIGLAYSFVRTGNSLSARLSRLAQSLGFIE